MRLFSREKTKKEMIKLKTTNSRHEKKTNRILLSKK